MSNYAHIRCIMVGGYNDGKLITIPDVVYRYIFTNTLDDGTSFEEAYKRTGKDTFIVEDEESNNVIIS